LGAVVEGEDEVEEAHNTSLAASLEPAPLTTPEELALFMNLHEKWYILGEITTMRPCQWILNY